MTIISRQQATPIDAVITWVDGASDAHRARRHTYMDAERMPLHQNATNPHRWACNDEILYCLQSIHNHAPWTRKIWIVVENEIPDLTGLSRKLTEKIDFAFHRDIFKGFDDALPTFNSLAIESLIWRIDGLSECFMYFNDDVFLTSPLVPSDVFQGDHPVLRGKWVDYSALLLDPDVRGDPAKFNHFMQINAAALMGFGASDLFRAAHVVHPLRRSKMAQLFDQHREAFGKNIRNRFRSLEQFLPQGLHNHACILGKEVVLHTLHDHVHIKSGHGNDGSCGDTLALLSSVPNSDIKFLCVNDLPQLEQIVPEARDWLGHIVGGFASA